MRFVLFAGMIAGAILLASCGGGDNATSTPRATTTSGVTATAAVGGSATPVPSSQDGAFTENAILRDYAITRNPGSGAAGPVFFHVSNTGPSKHEFVVVKTDLAKDQLPKKSDGSVDESQLNEIGKIGAVDPGSISTTTLTLDAGHYVFFCNIVDSGGSHYTNGMRADFPVQ